MALVAYHKRRAEYTALESGLKVVCRVLLTADKSHHAHAAVLDLDFSPPEKFLLGDAFGQAKRIEKTHRLENAILSAWVEHGDLATGCGAGSRSAGTVRVTRVEVDVV